MSIDPPELTKREQEMMAFFGRIVESTQSPILIAEALVAIHEKYPVREFSGWKLTDAWLTFTITTDTEQIELAIWRKTGNVYRITGGAVDDDPFITITPI